MKQKPLISFVKYFRLRQSSVISHAWLLISFFLGAQVTAQLKEPSLQQFGNYRQIAFQEKLFLHTDKNFYLTGEICWFKVYNVDASFHKPVDISKIAYVEILDKNNRAVLQTKLVLQNGNGNGSLQLSVALGSGKYKLRAYTNWMKNYSAEYFFEKTITIINTRKADEGITHGNKKKYDLQFFPEGGNLVNGIESKVAVRLVDEGGKGINTSGVIVNEVNDTILHFKTTKFGIGHFRFKPTPDQNYNAIISLSTGEAVSQKLPVAHDAGYVLQLANSGSAQVKVAVNASGRSYANSSVYLFAHTRNTIKIALVGKLENGRTEFIINRDILGEGVTHFTLFDAMNNPVCERLYFKYPEKQLQIKMSSDSAVYGIRTRVKVNLTVSDKSGVAEKSKMSMAVYRIDSLQPIDDLNITNYLWLNSDLAGTIESPEYYFKNTTSEVQEAMDNLMLTHGWRRFKWEEILKNGKPSLKYLPEYNGHILTGRITQSGSNSPARGIPVYYSVAGKKVQIHTSVSDLNGNLKFNIKNFYNEGEIIVQADSGKDSLYNVEIDNPFSGEYSERYLPSLLIKQINEQSLLKHHVSTQIQSVYYAAKFNQFRSLDDTSIFYTKPDVTYKLDNYVRFTTMEEVLIEYVREVKLKKTNGNYQLAVADLNQKLFLDNKPLVLLDGVPVFNTNKLIAYNPLNIEKLEVVARKYYLEDMLFNGIINIVTYNGNLKEYELDPNTTVIDYDGLQLQRNFFSPVYELKEQFEDRIPDYRNVLYWLPDISTAATGQQEISFYTSDVPGHYVIVLQGLSENGKTGYEVVQFEVKKQ